MTEDAEEYANYTPTIRYNADITRMTPSKKRVARKLEFGDDATPERKGLQRQGTWKRVWEQGKQVAKWQVLTIIARLILCWLLELLVDQLKAILQHIVNTYTLLSFLQNFLVDPLFLFFFPVWKFLRPSLLPFFTAIKDVCTPIYRYLRPLLEECVDFLRPFYSYASKVYFTRPTPIHPSDPYICGIPSTNRIGTLLQVVHRTHIQFVGRLCFSLLLALCLLVEISRLFRHVVHQYLVAHRSSIMGIHQILLGTHMDCTFQVSGCTLVTALASSQCHWNEYWKPLFQSLPTSIHQNMAGLCIVVEHLTHHRRASNPC